MCILVCCWRTLRLLLTLDWVAGRPEEDKLLYEWQAKLGNRWSGVAKKIPGRTGQQCAQRWRHKVNPNIRKEKWTEDEDRRLLRLVKQFGNCWAEISRRLDGRTDQQCMGRWRRHLDPSIKREAWQPHEDATLQSLYGQYGSQWSAIAHGINGRTAQQCRARFFQIDSDVAPPPHRRQARASPAADMDGEEDYFSDDSERLMAQRWPTKRQAAAKRRARRASRRRSASLSPFSEDEEAEEDGMQDDVSTRSEVDFPREARSGGESSAPPSDFPTPLKHAYARATEHCKDRAGTNGGGFTRSGRAVTANGSMPAEQGHVPISAGKLSAAVAAALREGRRAARRLDRQDDLSDSSPRERQSITTPSTADLSSGGGRRSSGRKSSVVKRSVDPSPPFLSPMRNCHSMPSESHLLGKRHFMEASPQSVRHRPSGATPSHEAPLANGASAPAEPQQEQQQQQSTPMGPCRVGTRGSSSEAKAEKQNGATRWRTASPGMNILQLLQSPHHVRDNPMGDSPRLGDKGLVTPEWAARHRTRAADEANTAPPLMHPDSATRSRVARRLNIDQAFKGSGRGKKLPPAGPRTVPQEQMGAPRRLGVSPAKRMRIESPGREAAACMNLGACSDEEELAENGGNVCYTDEMTDLDFDELRQQERRKVRGDKENKGACNALQQLCVAAASASAAEAAAEQGRQPSEPPPGAEPESEPSGLQNGHDDDKAVDAALAEGVAGKAQNPPSNEERDTIKAEPSRQLPRWIMSGVDGRVQATLEPREGGAVPKLEVAALDQGKPLSTSAHLRMRLHSLLEDLAGVI
ncbi:hypothetical protein WJX73_005770 [Symbiochloris irregularis]|uniref:Uncharacterized protein n=1 Tax=Symbiochloris irregularis TaxID=706552 RepID=A0AAW1NWV0_9CHLO